MEPRVMAKAGEPAEFTDRQRGRQILGECQDLEGLWRKRNLQRSVREVGVRI
jgi:hypothetical protein